MWRLIVLNILLSSCSSFAFAPKRSQPPATGNCVLDGTGGGECTDATGVQSHKGPNELLNYIALSPDDEKAFSSWCYSTPALSTEMKLH